LVENATVRTPFEAEAEAAIDTLAKPSESLKPETRRRPEEGEKTRDTLEIGFSEESRMRTEEKAVEPRNICTVP